MVRLVNHTSDDTTGSAIPRAAGYVLLLAPPRASLLENALESEEPFAEAVPEFDHSRSVPLVCYVSAVPGLITHVAEGRRGMRAGTGQRRLNLSGLRALSNGVESALILERLNRRISANVAARLSSGGLLPPKSSEALISVIMDVAPDVRDLLIRYSAERREAIRRLSEPARSALAAQKQAVTTALQIADIDRHALSDWDPPLEGKPTSFVEGLGQARVFEDSLIWHDQREPFPGFTEVRRSVTGAARFQDDDVVLEVIVANRTPLETQTGADLIYFNATFESFVLVQYKVMEKEGSKRDLLFRLPNSQLTEELGRMDRILQDLERVDPPAHRHHYRINSNPFFLKLCSRIVFEPESTGLTSGMYLPLGYWKFIEKDGDLLGPRGGRAVTFRNVGRHITNTDFATMVRNAWIGTTPQESRVLAPLIERLLTEGRAVVVALKTDKPRPEAEGEVDGDSESFLASD